MSIEMELSKQLVIGEVLARNARKYPDRPIFIIENQSWTYKEFNERVNCLANSLMELGVGKDDKVGVLFMNDIEIMESYYAIAKTGGVIVPFNFRLNGEELQYQIDYADVKVFILNSLFGPVIDPIRKDLPKVEHYIMTGEGILEGALAYEDTLNKGGRDEPLVFIDDEDPAAILFTAGTTGLPKGAVLSHKNLSMMAGAIGTEFRLPKGASQILVFPIFHSSGTVLTYATIYAGGTIVMVPLTKLDPETILGTIEKEKIYWGAMVPTLWNAVVSYPERHKFNLSSYKFAVSGAAPMPVEIKKRITELFPGIPGISDFFSQTETTTLTIPSDPADTLINAATVGKDPILHIEVRLVDENDNDVPVGVPGEAVFRGPTVFKEYYKNPSETAKAFKNGWFHSGDVLKQDEDGYFYVVDRIKDIIITGGENVSTVEVENILSAHPKIYESAIIGVPHEKWGETVKAVVALKPEEEATAQEIIDFSREKMAHYKTPTIVEFVKELPRNVAGKILKFKLREDHGKDS